MSCKVSKLWKKKCKGISKQSINQTEYWVHTSYLSHVDKGNKDVETDKRCSTSSSSKSDIFDRSDKRKKPLHLRLRCADSSSESSFDSKACIVSNGNTTKCNVIETVAVIEYFKNDPVVNSGNKENIEISDIAVNKMCKKNNGRRVERQNNENIILKDYHYEQSSSKTHEISKYVLQESTDPDLIECVTDQCLNMSLLTDESENTRNKFNKTTNYLGKYNAKKCKKIKMLSPIGYLKQLSKYKTESYTKPKKEKVDLQTLNTISQFFEERSKIYRKRNKAALLPAYLLHLRFPSKCIPQCRKTNEKVLNKRSLKLITCSGSLPKCKKLNELGLNKKDPVLNTSSVHSPKLNDWKHKSLDVLNTVLPLTQFSEFKTKKCNRSDIRASCDSLNLMIIPKTSSDFDIQETENATNETFPNEGDLLSEVIQLENVDENPSDQNIALMYDDDDISFDSCSIRNLSKQCSSIYSSIKASDKEIKSNKTGKKSNGRIVDKKVEVSEASDKHKKGIGKISNKSLY